MYIQKIIIVAICLSLGIGCSNTHRRSSKARRHQHKYTKIDDGAPKSKRKVNIAKIPNAIPKVEKKSRIGNPKAYKVFNRTYKVMRSSKGYRERGIASWYGSKFHGFKAANGETYDMYAMTAAHKTLPLPTYVKVTNLNNKRHIIVKVTDRGPFNSRLIDLSYAAASKLGILAKGTGRVEVQAIDPRNYKPRSKKKPIISEKKIIEAKNKQFVSVGEFPTQKSADAATKKLQTKFKKPVYVQKITTAKNTTKFKVQVGPITKTEELQSIKNQVQKLDLITLLIDQTG